MADHDASPYVPEDADLRRPRREGAAQGTGRVRDRSGRLTPGVPLDGAHVLATVHPSAVLRTGENREEMYAGLVADLRVVGDALG